MKIGMNWGDDDEEYLTALKASLKVLRQREIKEIRDGLTYTAHGTASDIEKVQKRVTLYERKRAIAKGEEVGIPLKEEWIAFWIYFKELVKRTFNKWL